MILIDSCILIEYLRGNSSIRSQLQSLKEQGLAMSTVTMMELLIGALNKSEIRLIKKTFADYQIIEITPTISILARNLIESYAKSHNLLIPDAFIAATAITKRLRLYTLNVADFVFIPQLKLL